jgi:hypothetical protein
MNIFRLVCGPFGCLCVVDTASVYGECSLYSEDMYVNEEVKKYDRSQGNTFLISHIQLPPS